MNSNKFLSRPVVTKSSNGYTFPARYEKPTLMKLEDYLSELNRTLNAVRSIIEKTAVKEKYIREEKGVHVYLATGSTENGKYAFARFNADLVVTSEDTRLIGRIMSEYNGKYVASTKRIAPGIVKIDTTVHQMMHDLFGEGEQSRFPL